MKDSKKWSVMLRPRFRRPVFSCLLLSSLMIFGSCKDDEVEGRSDFIIVSETPDKTPVSSVYCPVEGGRITLYVFSNVDYESFFQTSDADDQWVSAVSSEYLSGIGATRLTLQVTPLKDTFKKRTGTFSFASKEHFLGEFPVFTQGFNTRMSQSFTWLAFSGTPFTEGTPIAQWSAAQKDSAWTSTPIEALDNIAFCYGKNGYVKLGNDTVGGDLISPFFPNAITRDTLLILSFNAVTFTSESGNQDNNRLTVQALKGGIFSSGETSITFDLGNIDPDAGNLSAAMWDNTLHSIFIKTAPEHPFTADMKIRFITGDGDILASGRNRVFIDNINLYVVDGRSHYLAEGENSMNIK
jgi:hypothetical protein